MNRIAIGLITVVVLAGSALAEGDWNGVWRFVHHRDDGQLLPFHLVIQQREGEGPKVETYDNFWRPFELREIRLQEQEFFMLALIGGKPLRYEARAKGSGWKGKWTFPHPQYRMEGSFTAQKILDDPDWKPLAHLGELESQDKLYDLVRYLLDQVPLDDFASFERSWNEQIEPRFYALVHDLLYGHEDYQAKERRRRLQGVFRTLKDPTFQEGATRFARTYHEVWRDLAGTFPKLDSLGYVLTSPFPQGEAHMIVGEDLFTALHVGSFGAGLEDPIYRSRLAYTLVYARFLRARPLADSVAWRMFRVGAAAAAASRLKYSESTTDTLLVTDRQVQEVENSLLEWGFRLWRDLDRIEPAVIDSYFARSPKPGVWIAYRLMTEWLQDVELEKLIEVDGPAIRAAFRVFLQKEKARQEQQAEASHP